MSARNSENQNKHNYIIEDLKESPIFDNSASNPPPSSHPDQELKELPPKESQGIHRSSLS